MHNLTDELVNLIVELRNESIPEEIENIVKDCLLDYLGVTLGGARELKIKIQPLLDSLKCEDSDCHPIGFDTRMKPENAALINGMTSHYLELDDGSRFAMVHLGTVIFSTLLALEQKYNTKPDLFLRAALIGYECTLAVATSIQPEHKKRGFHATGTCGTIGAAAAAATLLELSPDTTKDVLSAAVASASGLLEMISDTSELKPFNSGKAAQNAIIALYMGMAGFEGPNDAIGGERGFIKVLGKDLDSISFARKDSDSYFIKTIYRKMYASCRHCHPAVEAVLKIKEHCDRDFSEIECIDVCTYDMAIKGHDHSVIQSVTSAKMSIPYSVAAAYVLNDGGIGAFSEESLNDVRIYTLASKVRVLENKDYSKLVPQNRIADVIICFMDGSKEQERIIFPKGEPENPLSRVEISEKVNRLLLYSGIGNQIQNEFFDSVEGLDKASTFFDICRSVKI